MKQSLVYLLALGIAFSWACSRIEQENLLPEPVQEGVELTVHATLADGAATRTVLRPNKEVFWTKGDAINLFYGDRSSGKFTSTIEEPKQTTDFVGTLTAATGSSEAGMSARKFWGVYPYNEANTCDGSSVTISLSNLQDAVPETFADKFNPSVAMSPGLDLAFYNVCAPFYFSVTNDKVTSITFKGNKNESIAGKVRVTMASDGTPMATVIEGTSSITVNAPAGESFEPGTTYVLLLFPQTLSSGYTVTMKRGLAKAECVVSTSAEFVRSKGRSKLEADKGLEYVSNQPENAIYYTSTDGKVVTPTAPDENFGANITSNTYTNGQGIITFDAKLTKLGGHSFDGCTTLATIDVPVGVTTIGDYAFYGCTNLTDVALPDGVKSLGYSAFSGCSSLKGIILPDAVNSLGNYVFNGCSSLKSITVPQGSTLIRSGSFNGCSGLTKVVLPEGITSIASSAFFGCSSLSDFTLPSTVKTVESNAFQNCSSLTAITLPNVLTSIGSNAFNTCRSLVSVTIPNSVTSIGDGAFGSCSSLVSFSGKFASSDGKFLVNDGKIIGVALAGLVGDITIPSGVKTIGESAFQACSKMTSVTVPESVTAIGSRAFYNCSGLTKATFLPTTPPSAGTNFFSSTNNAKIYVPASSVTAYKQTTNWTNYSNRIYAIE